MDWLDLGWAGLVVWLQFGVGLVWTVEMLGFLIGFFVDLVYCGGFGVWVLILLISVV